MRLERNVPLVKSLTYLKKLYHVHFENGEGGRLKSKVRMLFEKILFSRNDSKFICALHLLILRDVAGRHH